MKLIAHVSSCLLFAKHGPQKLDTVRPSPEQGNTDVTRRPNKGSEVEEEGGRRSGARLSLVLLHLLLYFTVCSDSITKKEGVCFHSSGGAFVTALH